MERVELIMELMNKPKNLWKQQSVKKPLYYTLVVAEPAEYEITT